MGVPVHDAHAVQADDSGHHHPEILTRNILREVPEGDQPLKDVAAVQQLRNRVHLSSRCHKREAIE